MYAAPAWWFYARAVDRARIDRWHCEEHAEWGISLVRPQKLKSWLVALKTVCWLPWLHFQPTFYHPFFCRPDDLGCVLDLPTFPCRIKTINFISRVLYRSLLH